MIKEVTITIYHDSNRQFWREIEEFSESWNKDHEAKLDNVMDINFTIGFEKNKPEYKSFMEWLDQNSAAGKLNYDAHEFITYEKADFQQADYINMAGLGLPDGFIANEKTAFGDAVECEACGYWDPWSTPQLEALIIDEQRLPRMEKERHCFNLDNGGLLLSKTAVDLFYKDNNKGIILKDVFKRNGQVSTDYFQVQAEKVLLFPDTERTVLTGYICPKCGVLHGQFESALFFSNREIQDADAFSMHPNHNAMIFFKKQIVNKLNQQEAGILMDIPAWLS